MSFLDLLPCEILHKIDMLVLTNEHNKKMEDVFNIIGGILWIEILSPVKKVKCCNICKEYKVIYRTNDWFDRYSELGLVIPLKKCKNHHEEKCKCKKQRKNFYKEFFQGHYSHLIPRKIIPTSTEYIEPEILNF